MRLSNLNSLSNPNIFDFIYVKYFVGIYFFDSNSMKVFWNPP